MSSPKWFEDTIQQAEPLRETEPPTLQIEPYLQSRSLLQVLDNFKHLVEAGEQLAWLLAMAFELKCLVATRERLNLAEGYLFPVQP